MSTDLPLTSHALGELALIAMLRDLSIPELVGQILAGAIKNDMIKEIAGDAGIARRTSRGEPPSFFYVGRILKGAGRLLW